jgi:hypothetical protein
MVEINSKFKIQNSKFALSAKDSIVGKVCNF